MQRPSFSIYNASAGSGKTYTLVKEYLKIILSSKKNDAYRTILAITFTNKAVHEMKTRIVGSLTEFAKDEPSQKALDLMEHIALEIDISVVKIKIKSKEIIKHIIHNYAAFDISTIDKFTHKVIRAFAHDLNLPITFEVTLDTENLLTEAVDAIIAKAGQDKILTKLLVDFTMEKTDDDKSWDISREILDTGRLALNENNRNEISHFKDKSIEEFIAIKTKLLELKTNFKNQTIVLAEEMLFLIENKGIDSKSFSGGYFPKHLISIKEGKFNPSNKTYHEFEDIKINKTAKDKATIEEVIPELLQRLAAIYGVFEKLFFYNAFLKNITPLSLLNTVTNELNKIQSEQNILSISEFNAIIHREIQNQPAPFIYERLGERYRHFFIDEFQDTSQMQWENLIPLIDNALAGQDDSGSKGTLMIVGDPKQSIYRWRGGKAEQFIELSKDKNPFSNKEKIIDHLDTNYRSYSEVIAFNNAFFSTISSQFEHVDYKDLYENHSYQKNNSKKGGYVNISFLPVNEKNDEQEELSKSDLYVLATLHTIEKILRNGFDYKDIAILTRKKDQGVAVANFLTQHKIPLLSSETLLIQNATEVNVIVDLLHYLNNNANLEAKVKILYFLALKEKNTIVIADFIAEGMKFKDEIDFEKWLQRFDVTLSFEAIRKKPLYEAVETIVHTFIKPTFNNAYIQYFLDVVLERDVRNQAGITDFLIYWEKNGHKFSIPSPEGNNAIRIMTIHKSKGLEFPVVIIPFAEEDYGKKPKDKLWLDAEEKLLGIPKVLIDNTTSVTGFGESAAVVFNEKKQEELLDNVNVLYVALTRAEEQLYVISQMIEPVKSTGEWPYNMASFFIQYLQTTSFFEANKLEYFFGCSTRLSLALTKESVIKTIFQVEDILKSESIKIAQKEALMWGTQRQEAIVYGNVIHEILSYVIDKNDAELAVIKAIESGLVTVDKQKEVQFTIQSIVNHPEIAICFEPGNKVLNEQTIIQKRGRTLKPDRMVIKTNREVYLLDYKTGNHDLKHEIQLQEYQEAIETMGFKISMKVLIYINLQIKVLNLPI